MDFDLNRNIFSLTLSLDMYTFFTQIEKKQQHSQKTDRQLGMSVQTTETLFSFMNTLRSKQFRMGDDKYKSPLNSWNDRDISNVNKRRRKDDDGSSSSKRRRGGGGGSSRGGGRSSSRGASRDGRESVDSELEDVDDENDFTGEEIEVFWGRPHNRWFKAYVKDYNKAKNGFSTLIYTDNTEEIAKLFPGGSGKALGDGGKLETMKWRLHKSSKRATSPIDFANYKTMIKKALRSIKDTKGSARGTFKDICAEMKRLFTKKLNWRSNGDARKTPVWKSTVRKILFSDFDFVRNKGTGPSGAHIFKLKR